MHRNMAPHSIVCWALSLFISSIWALDCFYPNGSLSTGTSREAPCYDSGICCPLDWICTSNGLCHYPPGDLYGRYSCTDPTWKDCPDICTYDHTAFGGEAVLQCDNGKWCCDQNRDESDPCCAREDPGYFKLATPIPQWTIESLQPVTSPTTTYHNGGTTTSEMPTTSSTPPTTTTPDTTSPPPTGATITHESTKTGTDGAVFTVTQVTTILPSSAGSADNQGTSSTSNLGMIIGIALGVPLFLIIVAIIAFLLWRRRRTSNLYSNIATRPSSPPAMANYSNIPPGTHASEISGFPVADVREKNNRTSELYGNDRYIYSPSASLQTGKSSPPSYSPNANRYSAAGETKSPSMPQIQEEPQELWGGYVPYRPPQNAQLPPERNGPSNPVSPL